MLLGKLGSFFTFAAGYHSHTPHTHTLKRSQIQSLAITWLWPLHAISLWPWRIPFARDSWGLIRSRSRNGAEPKRAQVCEC